MSYTTILTPVRSEPSDTPHLQAAIMLANTYRARLIGTCAQICVPSSMDGAFGPMDMTGALAVAERSVIDANLEAAEKRFRHATAGMSTPCEWRAALDFPVRDLARQAAFADLLVVGEKQSDMGDIIRSAAVGDVVMQAGRPVLFVPTSGMSTEPGTVIIAWKNSREARRAVADALPFLHRAEAVIAYSVLESADEQEGRADLIDLVDYLKAREIKATGVTLPPSGSGGEDILSAASRAGANLIVSGAYGRSRLQEWAFGGVTRALLEHTTVPVLFSH